MKDYQTDRRLQQKLLILCSILTKASRVEEGGMAEHMEFSSNVIEAMLLLIKCDFVEVESASVFVSEYLKVHA